MDPLTLGAVAAAVVAKAVDRAEDGAINAASSALSRLTGWLRERLGSSDSLQRLEEAPDSPSRLQALASEIDRRTMDEPAFRDHLRELLGEAQNAGLDVKSVALVAWGHHNVQVADVTGSDIRVSYGRHNQREQ